MRAQPQDCCLLILNTFLYYLLEENSIDLLLDDFAIFFSYQVTFDVAWSPDGIDGRNYDYLKIAEYTDFVVVMSYDEQSQIYGDCKALPNSGIMKTKHGMFYSCS